MRSLYQIQRSNTEFASRADALNFTEKCLTKGPQAVYEPSENWRAAHAALSRGWVYVETLPVYESEGTVQRFISNLKAADIKELRA
jgi:hypothetical protein